MRRESRSPGPLVRTKFLNDIREARTGPDGVYKLVGCEPKTTRMVVSAKGRATDMKELMIEPDMGPVDFRMKPGGTVRIRVARRRRASPVPKARIFFQRWRGDVSSTSSSTTSLNTPTRMASGSGTRRRWMNSGRTSAPPTGRNCSQQPLIAREQEYVFRVSRVARQGRAAGTDEAFASSACGEAVSSRRDREDALGREGLVTTAATTPRPAAGAKVALGVAGSQINVTNGEIDDGLDLRQAGRDRRVRPVPAPGAERGTSSS